MKHKHLSEPFYGYFQIRINRDNETFTKSFSEKEYKCRMNAKKAALDWRNNCLKQLGDVNRELGGGRINETTGINGIYRQLKGGGEYLRFTVHYRDDKRKAKNKEFSAGNIEKLTIEKELYIFMVALLFRKEYEFSRENTKHFKFKPVTFKNYKYWNKTILIKRFAKINISALRVEQFIDDYLKFKAESEA